MFGIFFPQTEPANIFPISAFLGLNVIVIEVFHIILESAHMSRFFSVLIRFSWTSTIVFDLIEVGIYFHGHTEPRNFREVTSWVHGERDHDVSTTDYGVVEGKLIRKSPTSTVTDTAQGQIATFDLEIELAKNCLYVENKCEALKPGDTVTAEVIVRKRKAIDFILDPFKKLQKGGLEL